MFFSPWKLSASQIYINCVPQSCLLRLPACIVECAKVRICELSLGPCFRKMHGNACIMKTPHVVAACWEECGSALSKEKGLAEEILLDNSFEKPNSNDCANAKEIERRRKIGLANKGKIPWNKGGKHSAETRERIRQRTKEAMKDPKVRKKMSECPRTHSNQTKARIGSSLRKVWGRRLRGKRSKEAFLKSWAESIAIAAKMGGTDQQELDWDSYDKLKKDMALEQLRWAAEKAKAKAMARMKAETAAKAKAEKMERLLERGKEREKNGKIRGESSKKPGKKSGNDKGEIAISNELKLKERLMKIHKKRSAISQVSRRGERHWDKFETDLLKREQSMKDVSLADQIRFAKNKRTACTVHETSSAASSGSS